MRSLAKPTLRTYPMTMRRLRTRSFPDEQDFLLILAVLALSFFVLRQRGWHADRNPVVAAVGSSAAMDGLWRDSVRPLKDGEDNRPPADPDIVWDERDLYRRAVAPAPAPRPLEKQPEAEPESYFFPEPRPAARPAAERPRLSPTRISFAERESAHRSKAFLRKPEDEKR